MRAAGRQLLHGLLVADEGTECLGQILKERVVPALRGRLAGDGADRLAVALLADLGAEMVGEDADAVAAAEKRQVVLGEPQASTRKPRLPCADRARIFSSGGSLTQPGPPPMITPA